MKKLFLIFMSFISLNTGSAQVTLEEGSIVKSGMNVPRKILGKNEKYFFVLRTNLENKKHTIEKYAIADMLLVSTTDITLGNKGKQFIVLKDAFYLNGKILVFRTSTDHTIYRSVVRNNCEKFTTFVASGNVFMVLSM